MFCPVHPFPLRGTSPQGETRDMREKTASHILHVPFRRFPSLVAVALWTSPADLRVDGPLGRRFLRGLSLTRLWCEGCGGAPLNYRRRPFIKNLYNRPAGVRNASPFGGWRHHLARWEACHWIRGSRGSPMNPVPLPPPTSWGHYKAPLCCELLMKGLLFRALFCPLNRGQSGAARIGGGERSEPVSRIPIITYDTGR